MGLGGKLVYKEKETHFLPRNFKKQVLNVFFWNKKEILKNKPNVHLKIENLPTVMWAIKIRNKTNKAAALNMPQNVNI